MLIPSSLNCQSTILRQPITTTKYAVDLYKLRNSMISLLCQYWASCKHGPPLLIHWLTVFPILPNLSFSENLIPRMDDRPEYFSNAIVFRALVDRCVPGSWSMGLISRKSIFTDFHSVSIMCLVSVLINRSMRPVDRSDYNNPKLIWSKLALVKDVHCIPLKP